MKNKGLIITNAIYKSPSTINQIERLTTEFGKLNITIESINNDSFFAYINQNDINCSIKQEYDFVIYLDKDPYIVTMLEKCGVKVFNNADAIKICDDKMSTYIKLANNNIRMPKTISNVLVYQYDDAYFNDFSEKLEKQLEYPFVLKENNSSLGMGVYLINNREEFKKIYSKVYNKPHVYQKLIKESFGTDLRLILVNKKVVACMKRQSNGIEFRSNISLGGTATKYESKPAFDFSEKIAILLDLDYCGIDLLFTNSPEEFYLCEVNSNAYFKEIEKITGINVASLYAKHIYEKIYKK
ncbi:MAG: RimK family alpha-L-glutamate ligase [Clostridia bacterium]|nr:RimK family alpha-L-glutamate ligase [Clostridia bacterium]